MVKNARYFPLADSSGKMTNSEGTPWQCHCAFVGLRETGARIRIAFEYIQYIRTYCVIYFLHAVAIYIGPMFMRFAAAKVPNGCTEKVTKKISGSHE